MFTISVSSLVDSASNTTMSSSRFKNSGLKCATHDLEHGLLLRIGVQATGQKRRTEVRGEDQNRVAEVDGPSLPVRQPAVVENLQQHIEDIGVRLFDLVEQHHRIRSAPHRFG